MFRPTRTSAAHREGVTTGPTHDLVLSLVDVVAQVKRQHGPDSAVERGAVSLLAHLARTDGVRGGDLAHQVCLDASTVSRHLRSLESAGYVDRRADLADARASLVAITPAGQEFLDRLISDRVATFERATAGWTVADRTTLARLMARLADDLENL
jgi:DNA-binding MarR family transcriptional regulator